MRLQLGCLLRFGLPALVFGLLFVGSAAAQGRRGRAPVDSSQAYTAFKDNMATRLKLTEAQHDTVWALVYGAIKKTQALRSQFMGGGGRPDRSAMMAMRDQMGAIQEETDQPMAAVLTEDQMKEYRKIRQEEMERRRGGGRRPF